MRAKKEPAAVHVFVYTLPLFASSLFAAWLGLLGWRRRHVAGALPFTVLMACGAWWQLTYSLELASPDIDAKLMWVDLEYPGIVSVPVAWLVCAHQISGLRVRRAGLVIALLLTIPLITVLLKWTDRWHGLVWSDYTVGNIGALDVLLPMYGPWFTVHTVFSFGAVIAGTVLLLRFALRTSPLYRLQVSALIAGTIAPWIGIFLYLSRVVALDLTPYAFTITGTLFMYSLFRLRLFELMPVARDTLIENMHDGILVLDERQRVIDLNRAARTLLGTGGSVMVGQQAGMLPELAGLRYDERETEQRLLIGQGDGVRYIDVTVTPLRRGRAQLSGHLLILRDVTRRVEMEQAVRESEGRYRAVSELTSDYTFSFSIDERGELLFDWVTDSFTPITGYIPQELRPLGGWIGLIHPDDREAALGFAKQLVAGESVIADFRIVTKAGEVRWLRNYARPEMTSAGGTVTRIVGASCDITATREATAALQDSEQRYRQLFEHNPYPMWVYDIETLRFLAVNEAAVRHYGWSREEFLGLSIYDIRPAEDIAEFEAYRASKESDVTTSALWRHVTRDGTYIDVEVSAHPVVFAGRRARVVLATDVTERRRAESELAMARDQALEAARLKSEFLAIMSHELRTPLNAIIGFTEVTLNASIGPLNDQQRSALHRVSRNAHQLLELINGLLDMSTLDANGVRLAREEVRIADIVQAALYNVEALAAAKRLRMLVRKPSPEVPLLIGDAGRLHQIVLNLLSNAIKFSPDQASIELTTEFGPAGTIQAPLPAAGAPDGEWFVISVCDTGIGIPADEQERIWSEFYQVDGSPTRRFGGTGLGLAIVRRLAQRMGGHVALRSAVGHGSTFSVWLPAAPVEAAASP